MPMENSRTYLCHCCCCSLSRVRLFATLWTAAHQAFLSFSIPWSLLKMMPSHHLILCHLLLLLPSIFPSIRVFSNEFLRIRWPEYWSFSFTSLSISATSNVEHIPCHLATLSYLSRDIKYFLSQSIWHSETYLSRLHILFLPRTTESRAGGPRITWSDHLRPADRNQSSFWDALLLPLKTCSATKCVLPIKRMLSYYSIQCGLHKTNSGSLVLSRFPSCYTPNKQQGAAWEHSCLNQESQSWIVDWEWSAETG